MRSLALVLLAMGLGVGALVYLVRPSGQFELSDPASPESPGSMLDRPLASPDLSGSPSVTTTTASPDVVARESADTVESGRLTLSEARARLMALPRDEMSLDRASSLRGLLEHADLSSLKREVRAMDLAPLDLQRLYLQESDQEMRAVYLLGLGFCALADQPAAEVRDWWQAIASDPDPSAARLAGAARFAAIRTNPALCARLRDEIQRSFPPPEERNAQATNSVQAALDVAFGSAPDADNLRATREILEYTSLATRGWTPAVQQVLGRADDAESLAELIPQGDTAEALAADYLQVGSWSFVEGPGLLNDLVDVAFSTDLPRSQLGARLHARLYVAGNYEADGVQAVAALEAVEDTGELNVLLNEVPFVRPQLARSTVALLAHSRGSEELRRLLAKELTRVSDHLDRAVLPGHQARQARNALLACDFRPDDEGRFGPDLEAWVAAQFPPE